MARRPWRQIRDEAAHSRRCDLWRRGTQTVFGAGPLRARFMMVGEQPGDQEDLAGRPFVGPAGKVFDAVLKEADIVRDSLYLTNAVKHFKYEPRGKRRIHQKPDRGEIEHCRWWLAKEVELVKPRLSLPGLIALFFATLLARAVRADMRKRIRELLGRSYA